MNPRSQRGCPVHRVSLLFIFFDQLLLLPIAVSQSFRYNVHYTQTFVFPGRTHYGGTVLCRPRGLAA
jgi:hypothetical protein